MNKNRKQFKYYRLIQSINYLDRKEGSVKIYSNNSYLHELVKFQIAYKLKSQGYKVFTECRLSGGGRADIVAISKNSDGYIIEVINSETEARFNKKLNDYPLEFDIIKVNCKDFDINSWDL